MIRVTRPDGVVAAAVWDYGDGMQMLRVFWDEAVALDPAAAGRDERHMPLSGRGELSAFWRDIGLRTVEEPPLTVDMAFASFDDFWQPFLHGEDRQGPMRPRCPNPPAMSCGQRCAPAWWERTPVSRSRPVRGRYGASSSDRLGELQNVLWLRADVREDGVPNSRPSNERPARSSTRADRVLSTWHIAEIRYTFGSLSISASRSETTSDMIPWPHHRRPRQ